MNILDGDISVITRDPKKEDALCQLKNKMQTLYDATSEGKYKFLTNNKIVYVTKNQIKRKPSKRCSSTDGTGGQNFNVKTKIGRRGCEL